MICFRLRSNEEENNHYFLHKIIIVENNISPAATLRTLHTLLPSVECLKTRNVMSSGYEIEQQSKFIWQISMLCKSK